MAFFKDKSGNEWNISIDVYTLKKLHNSLDIDTSNIDSFLKNLYEDVIFLCDVLYVCCKEQADSKGISDEQFGKNLSGDVLEKATEAFLEAFADFYPARKASYLKNQQAKMKAAEEKLMTSLEEVQNSEEIDRAIEKKIEDMKNDMLKDLEL